MQYNYFHVKDNAEAQLSGNIGASTLTILLGTGKGALFPQPYSGTTTSLGTSTTLNKTGIGASGIVVGDFIENTTDGSHAYVTVVSTDSLTTTELQGGSVNTWQNGHAYLVNPFIGTLNKRNASGVITASEKVKIIGRSVDSLTVDPAGRGYDTSTAQSFVVDDYFNVFVVAKSHSEIRKGFADVSQQLDLKASLAYVQAMFAARLWKDPVRVATTAAGTLATSFENGDTIDGVVLATGDRILIKDQASSIENGIYVVAASGAPTRATDFDATAEITSASVAVTVGSSNGDTIWLCTSDSPTVGVSNINFVQLGGSVAAPVGTVASYAGYTAPSGWLLCDGSAVSRATYSSLYPVIVPNKGTFTVTIATPAVLSLTAHGMQIGDSFFVTTTGALPTGMAQNTLYYVITAGFGANSFQFSASRGGAAVNTSGSQSGTHTLRHCPFGLGDGSTTFNVPDLRAKHIYGYKASDADAGYLGQAGGATTSAHTHPLSSNGQAQFGSDPTIAYVREVATTTFTSTKQFNSLSSSTPGNTKATGLALAGATDSTSPSILNPYAALNFIIKT